MYVALALRAVLPLVLGPFAVFVFLALIFAVVGAPFVARGVRAVVRGAPARLRRGRGVAGRRPVAAAGPPSAAGRARLRGGRDDDAGAGVHRGRSDAVLRGASVFPSRVATWGTMLQEASSIRTLADFPWLLSPAAAIFLLVLGLNAAFERQTVGEVAIPRIDQGQCASTRRTDRFRPRQARTARREPACAAAAGAPRD